MGKILGSDEIGRRLREYRQKAGLTQEQLAELVDVSFQQIQKYESGATKLNTDRLQKLSNALSLSIGAFFDSATDAPFKLSKEERRLIEAFRSINEESARTSILNLAEHVAVSQK